MLNKPSEDARSKVLRRDFTRSAAAAAASVLTGLPAEPRDRVIGIQLGAVSLVDEGTEQVLDILLSPIYRAEQDYAELARDAGFLKIAAFTTTPVDLGWPATSRAAATRFTAMCLPRS